MTDPCQRTDWTGMACLDHAPLVSAQFKFRGTGFCRQALFVKALRPWAESLHDLREARGDGAGRGAMPWQDARGRVSLFFLFLRILVTLCRILPKQGQRSMRAP